MARKVFLRAREGIQVPLERAPRRYITDQVAVEVELTTYYRRQLRDGDLVEATPVPVSPAKKAAPKE